MGLNLVKARVLPGKGEALDGYLVTKAADPAEEHVKEALRGGHWTGATVYFAVEPQGRDPTGHARDLLSEYVEVLSVTPIESVEGVEEDEDDAPARKSRAARPAKKAKRSAMSEED